LTTILRGADLPFSELDTVVREMPMSSAS